jgi:hypothetical protein
MAKESNSSYLDRTSGKSTSLSQPLSPRGIECQLGLTSYRKAHIFSDSENALKGSFPSRPAPQLGA